MMAMGADLVEHVTVPLLVRLAEESVYTSPLLILMLILSELELVQSEG